MHHVCYMNATHAASAMHTSTIHQYDNTTHFTSTNASYYLNKYTLNKQARQRIVAYIKCTIAFGVLNLLHSH